MMLRVRPGPRRSKSDRDSESDTASDPGYVTARRARVLSPTGNLKFESLRHKSRHIVDPGRACRLGLCGVRGTDIANISRPGPIEAAHSLLCSLTA